jgi:hypothetical protein
MSRNSLIPPIEELRNYETTNRIKRFEIQHTSQIPPQHYTKIISVTTIEHYTDHNLQQYDFNDFNQVKASSLFKLVTWPMKSLQNKLHKF